MYSRTYFPERDEKINLPDSYDGVAFGELKDSGGFETQNAAEETTPASVIGNPWEKGDEPPPKKEPERRGGGFLSGLFPSQWMKNLFGKDSLFGHDGLWLSKIGTEELLIIATALFLLFSKDGDKECALILLFLLFVN